ncbi:nicotinate (nicotinamide) nucleotide adenylyltransferase [Mariniplasma anaerobium]|uniref:Probable nicotinate-nucleotide adenylyltransferase n=1 Tax=Mariniplasma anaerobium TaxID=2735436 RepID=A0A7U9TGP6_9MOLU|nr:nicotinate (nicotinamide) nucleotide adenylyltransferase [Mariniplasma anaerobium]BCR35835.1 putative nicotinate-nucleotide adenylyltransferase [Mariniplasma anaerobium]
MNIIYGGSFNPPTIAHLHIIITLLKTFENSKVIVLPVGNDYKKPDLIDFNHRFLMLKLLIETEKKDIVISDLENHSGYSGTLKALEDLSKTYEQLHFVIGSDHLESLKTWISYQDLLDKYPFIVMNRNHFMTKEQAEMMFKDVNHKFIFIDFDMDVSSSKIREDIDKNKKYLTNEVYQYIKNHKLYEVL